MNSKLLNCEDGRIKIDNIKNITLSDIINLIRCQKIKIPE